jgi:RNA polymerase sigma factor (sigma-70 family)
VRVTQYKNSTIEKGENIMKTVVEEVFESEFNNFKGYLISRFNQLNEYDAEDIISQTVLKLLTKGDDMLGINNVTSYVYSSLKNGAIDHMKKRRFEVYNSEYEQVEKTTIESEVLRRELKQIIKNAIEALDEKSKYIFIETEIKGRSYKAISKQTGEKLGSLLSRKSRAMKKLQILLSDYIDKEEKKND